MASYSDSPEKERAFWSIVRASARRRSDGALALVTAVGLVGITVVPMYAPALWRPGLAFVVLAAFGAWGILDRSVKKSTWQWKTIQVILATAGLAAALLLLLALIEFVLYNIRS